MAFMPFFLYMVFTPPFVELRYPEASPEYVLVKYSCYIIGNRTLKVAPSLGLPVAHI